jgi:hypothetical protein
VYFTRQALATANHAARVTLTMHCSTAINQLAKRMVPTMAEFIERQVAIDAVTAVYTRTAGYKTRERVWETREAIQKLPAADVAPVVRCKDCKYWQDNNDNYPHEECRWGHGETPDANDFCSYGERKEND